MASRQVGATLRQIERLFRQGTAAGLADAELLERFAIRGDEGALEVLIARHGPMVLAVCRGVLKDPDDAQDAFQSTFLVLVRKAHSLWVGNSLGSWLYRVAYRISVRAGADALKRRRLERGAARDTEVRISAPAAGDDMATLLHAEVDGLPEKYRAPIVLCYFEGMTHEQASQHLGWTVGMVRGRVAKARERLRARLDRKGAALSVGMLSGAVGDVATPAPLPAGWVAATIRGCEAAAADTAIGFWPGVLKTLIRARLVIVPVLLAVVAGPIFWEFTRGAASPEGPQIAPPLVRAEEPAPTTAEPFPVLAFADAPLARPRPDLDDKRVRTALSGHVVDEAGKPVPTAAVRLRLIRPGNPVLSAARESLEVWQATTDAEGKYEFAGVPAEAASVPEEYALDVLAPGFVVWSNFQAARVPAPGGSLKEVRLVRGVAVSGRCVAPDGRPVPGAIVRKWYEGKSMSVSGPSHRTDEDGRFAVTFPAVGGGELLIVSDRWAPLRIDVPPGVRDLGTVRPHPGTEVVGRLLAEDGGPLAGKVVALEGRDGGRLGVNFAVKTAVDGSFRLPPLVGSFKLWTPQAHHSVIDDRGPVFAEGPPPAVPPQILRFAPGAGRRDLTLRAGRGLSLKGTIVGLDGKPAAGVAIYVMIVIGPKENAIFNILQWALTDAEDRYALTGIPPGLLTGLSVLKSGPDGTFLEAVPGPATGGSDSGGQGVIYTSLDESHERVDFTLRHRNPPEPPQVLDAGERQLSKLGEELQKSEESYRRASEEARGDPVRQKAFDDRFAETFPPYRFAERFLTFAESHHGTHAALSALAYVFDRAGGEGNPDSPLSQGRLRGIAIAQRDHLKDPDLTLLLGHLIYGAPQPEAEAFLRAALAGSPHREVRAAARYELARFLRAKVTRSEIGGARSPVDTARTLAEAETLLEQSEREDGDVRRPSFLADGPGLVLRSRYTKDVKPRTYGDLAGAERFAMKNLAVGQIAPEIEGREVDGRSLKLSDYRGTVVVLTFSGNWCGPCRALYPEERALAARLEGSPFAILSVNTDTEKEILRKSIGSREITWRCWWDGGQEGPITLRWSIQRFPSVFVIDAHGVIRALDVRGKELEELVDRLVAEVK